MHGRLALATLLLLSASGKIGMVTWRHPKHLLKLQCDGQRANTQLTTCLQAVERDMDERYEGLTLLVEEKSAGESRVGCCL